jgi:hypothetical protein
MEAELMAIEEGIQLSLQWSTMQFKVESDCADAVEMINDTTPNFYAYAFKVNVIRELLRERKSRLVKISREINSVSHELAKIGSDEGMTNGPPILAYLVFGPGRVSLERLLRPIKAAV